MGYPRLLMLPCCLILALLVLSTASCNLPGKAGEARTRQRMEELSRQNLHMISHQLEKWSLAHNGLYPDNINALLDDGNLKNFPINAGSLSSMRQVEFTDSDRNGNFSYYPVYGKDAVHEYYLIGYGFEFSEGEDLDGDGKGDDVLLVLNSSTAKLPPLPEVLSGKHSTPPLLFSRLDTLQQEIEQWAKANATQAGIRYPERLEPGSSPVELPQNPFEAGSMRPVRIGEQSYSGNFAYVPFRYNGVVKGYYLLGFGSESTEGYDVNQDGSPDHVVKILRQGPESMPDLNILLGQLQDG
jgi:hypothetical protein